MYPRICIEYLVFVRVSCSNNMSGCLSSMAVIRIFLLQWKPRMFQEMMLRSLPSCPLISLGCVVLRVLVLFVLSVLLLLSESILVLSVAVVKSVCVVGGV